MILRYSIGLGKNLNFIIRFDFTTPMFEIRSDLVLQLVLTDKVNLLCIFRLFYFSLLKLFDSRETDLMSLWFKGQGTF